MIVAKKMPLLKLTKQVLFTCIRENVLKRGYHVGTSECYHKYWRDMLLIQFLNVMFRQKIICLL